MSPYEVLDKFDSQYYHKISKIGALHYRNISYEETNSDKCIYVADHSTDWLTRWDPVMHLCIIDLDCNWYIGTSNGLSHVQRTVTDLLTGDECRQTSNISHTYWSLRFSWSSADRPCSNYIFILDLTPGLNGLDKDTCTTRGETFKLLDLVRLILEVWW